jgi:hypothetical protein
LCATADAAEDAIGFHAGAEGDNPKSGNNSLQVLRQEEKDGRLLEVSAFAGGDYPHRGKYAP